MKILAVAEAGKQPALAAEFADDFTVTSAVDAPAALEILRQQSFDALLVDLGLGESKALDVLYGARKLGPDRQAGSVVIIQEIDLRSVIEVMRAGAFDVLVEGSLRRGELAHSMRNAVLHAQLSRRRQAQSKEVLVVGTGASADAVVLLLEAVGHTVRHVPRMPDAGDPKSNPRAIVVDLSAVGDGEALLKLLAPG